MISLKNTALIALLFSNFIITDSSCSSTERANVIGCFLFGATVIGCVALLIKTEQKCRAAEQEAQEELNEALQRRNQARDDLQLLQQALQRRNQARDDLQLLQQAQQMIVQEERSARSIRH